MRDVWPILRLYKKGLNCASDECNSTFAIVVALVATFNCVSVVHCDSASESVMGLSLKK